MLAFAATPASAGSWPPCARSSTSPSVTICTPGSGATLSLPVHLVARTTDSSTVLGMKVLIDGVQVYSAGVSTLDVYLTSVAYGKHTLTVTAWDSSRSFSRSIPVNITASSGLSKLNHIIIYMLENRSFDNYFGRLGAYKANKGLSGSVDGLNLSKTLYDSAGKPVRPYHFRTVCHENLQPDWNRSQKAINGGNMDRFMKVQVTTTIDPYAHRTMGYYDWTDLPYYYDVASQFATSDRFFSSVLAGTIPNRMYLFAGTSFGHIHPDPPPSAGWPQKTIFDLLTQYGVYWRYYYQDNSIYLSEWAGWPTLRSKVYPISYYFQDLNNGTLPQVVFLERPAQLHLDEHPGDNIQSGAANTKKLVDALMRSSAWKDSVFIITYDEGGGLYDHVTPGSVVPPDSIPPIYHSGDVSGDFKSYGYRVPLMVISPWVRPHLVSHTWRDFGSILRMIETRFKLPALTARDATADSMMEFFDFSSPHWLTPPPLAGQPINGTCDFNQELP